MMGQQKKATWSLTAFLAAIWALSILYGEMFAFWVPSLWTCSWPPPHLPHNSSQVEGLNDNADYVKIAVLSDPLLMDRTSGRLPPKSLAREIAQFYSDLYIRRAFFSSILPFKPDVILFLGGYLDGGHLLSNDEWHKSLDRLRHIFYLNMLQKTTNIKVYFLSGSHDIGYAAFHSKMPQVIRRHEEEFGERNYRFTLGKVDFIAIDSQTLDGNSKENVTSATWDFISNVSKDSSSSPRVLLTHLPLYRADWTKCGPHRSSPVINQRIRHSPDDQEIEYQNYVTEKSTNNLLNLIKPALILSGHDPDQCTVTHMATFGPVDEHTVGTISWQQGNLFPSFMLLSASNLSFPDRSTPEDVISTQLCFLPIQTCIYIWYLVLFMSTLIVILFWPTTEVVFLRTFGYFRECMKSLVSFTIFGGITKEKNEDENCEYEMLWGADGSIHMMKKTSKPTSKSASDRVSVERGNAVMRSTAKRQSGQEVDLSMPDVSVNVGLDTAIPARAKKSKTESVIRRLLHAIRVLTLVAAVNVPLYMMLLFKDWIDK